MAKLLVKEICKAKGISLKVLAEKMGITPSALSQSLSNPNPSIQSLERIAKALHVNLSELFVPDYGAINGFVKVNDEIISIQTPEQWLDVTGKIEGLFHVPASKELDSHRKSVENFCLLSINAKRSGAMMMTIGTMEIFSLCYEAGARKFHLTLCYGREQIVYRWYDVMEYCGASEIKTVDVEFMIKDILNDIEAVFDDKDFGEMLK